MTFHLACSASAGPDPGGSANLAYIGKSDRLLCVLNRVYLTSKDLVSVYTEGGPYGMPIVQLTFTAQGAARLASFTQENLDREMVLVLDGEILLVANIMAPITGGRMQITGKRSQDDTRKLVEHIQQAIRQPGN